MTTSLDCGFHDLPESVLKGVEVNHIKKNEVSINPLLVLEDLVLMRSMY